jgi:phospholipid/cholesterol/gamma-HCH transport system ATP-binding protein
MTKTNIPEQDRMNYAEKTKPVAEDPAKKKDDSSVNASSSKICLSGVTKAFGKNKVLQGVDIEIPKGKSLVVIGGSGTGKSVMLKCVLGLLHADSGSIQIDGQEIVDLKAKEMDDLMRKFGMLFQGAALFDSLKIWENVAFGLVQGRGMSKKDAHDIAIEKLRAVGLKSEVGDLYPAELSGGMQKRVGLARAVAATPEIIFFDEPTTGLDPIMADVINELIVDQVKDLGATALSITHDMSSVRKIADHVAMIHEGRIVWHGAVEDLDHSGNPYVEQFIHGRADGPITSSKM